MQIRFRSTATTFFLLSVVCIVTMSLRPNFISAAEPPTLKQTLHSLGYQTVERGLPIVDKSPTDTQRVEIESPARTSVREYSTTIKALPLGLNEDHSRVIEYRFEAQTAESGIANSQVALQLRCHMLLFDADGRLIESELSKPVMRFAGVGPQLMSWQLVVHAPLRSGNTALIILCQPGKGEQWQLLSYHTARITRLD